MHPERLAVYGSSSRLQRRLCRCAEPARCTGCWPDCPRSGARSVRRRRDRVCGRRSSGTRHVVALRDQRRPHRPARPSDRLPVRKLRRGIERVHDANQRAALLALRTAKELGQLERNRRKAGDVMAARRSRAETFADPGGGTPPLAGKARNPGTCRGSDDRTATARRAASAGRCRSPTPNSPPSPPRR